MYSAHFVLPIVTVSLAGSYRSARRIFRPVLFPSYHFLDSDPKVVLLMAAFPFSPPSCNLFNISAVDVARAASLQLESWCSLSEKWESVVDHQVALKVETNL